MSKAAATASGQQWYRTLNATQWKTLLASNLGWVFDGFETFALILTVGVALRQLLDPSEYTQIPTYAGAIIAMTLIGWALGGMTAGILADYIGRKRTMILAILTYSIMTGLSAFAWDFTSFAAMRFLVGLAIGSEWVTGTSMTAEFWPDHARGRGAGLFQCGFGIGFFLASFVWLFVGATGPGAWRTMYLIGILPAFLTLWIRRAIPESALWEKANERRLAATERKRRGAVSSTEDLALTRFTLVELFVEPTIRRRTIIALLMATASAVDRHDLHRRHDRGLYRIRLSRGRLWTKADHAAVLCDVAAADASHVPVDVEPVCSSSRCSAAGLLRLRAVYLDVDVVT
jgi:MFS family permease